MSQTSSAELPETVQPVSAGPPAPAPRSIPRSTGRRFFLLFTFLLASLILYPLAESTQFGYYALRALGSAVIFLSVYAVSFRRTFLIFAVLLAIPALAQHLWLLQSDPSLLAMLNIVFSFCFDLFIVTVIFRRIFAKDHATSETIFGALCIYLLVGFGFASLFHLTAAVQPAAFYFDPHATLHPIPDRLDFIYYSFGTLTSVGAAGILPVTAYARSLTILEAVLGVLFLAVLVSRLMDVYRVAPSAQGR